MNTVDTLNIQKDTTKGHQRKKKTFLVQLLETCNELVINIRVIDCNQVSACLSSVDDIVGLTVMTDSIEVLEPFNVSQGMVSFITRARKSQLEGMFLTLKDGQIELEV